MKLLYFAWLREKVGKSGETIDMPEGVHDVAGLVAWLQTQGAGYDVAFADLSVVKVAVNQEFVNANHAITEGDEVAFFPPVTGG